MHVKPPKGKHVSFCTFCERTVGVVRNTYNLGNKPPEWRLRTHKPRPDATRKCFGSSISVPFNVVMDNV